MKEMTSEKMLSLYHDIVNRSLQARMESVVISSGTMPGVDVLTPAGDPTFRVLSFVEGDNRVVAEIPADEPKKINFREFL